MLFCYVSMVCCSISILTAKRVQTAYLVQVLKPISFKDPYHIAEQTTNSLIAVVLVGTTYNVFSYFTAWAEHRTHHLLDAMRMRYLLCHGRE